MERLVSDVRYGFRSLLSKPGTAAVAIVTLAIGIGANTAIFSVVHHVLLRPLPYEEPEELVMVWQDLTRRGGPLTEWPSPDNFFDWREQNQVFEGMFALGVFRPTLSGVDEPEQLNGAQASYDALSLLGIEPVHGRGFRREEDTAASEPVVILGYALWQRRFGGDPEVLGSVITLDREPVTVVGVMPPGLDFPIVGTPDVIAPLGIDRSNACGRSCYTLRVIARLEDGMSLARARSDMDAVAARLESEYPEHNTGVGIHLVPLHEQIVGSMRTALLVLLGAVGFVLLIACANVANLMLARAADREREVATRIAMGASRGRVLRQLLTESVLLAGAGAGLGVILALWGVDLLVSLVPDSLPRLADVTVDQQALAFTLVVAVLTGFAFGLVPAARASRLNLHRSLKEGSRGSSGGRERFRSALVIAEVALALALLVGAGLLLRSFATLIQVDPGFAPDNVFTAQLNLAGSRYDEPEARISFVARLLAGVRSLPGVEGADVVHVLPLGGANVDTDFLIEGRARPRPAETPVAWYRPASPGYFETMKMRLVRGRWFREADDPEAPPVVLINEAAAKRYWPNEDPLASRVRIGQEWRQVVGIVADVKQFGLDEAERPAMYFPYAQLPQRFMSLVARTAGDPEALAGAVRAVVREIDPELAVAGVASMRDVISQSVAAPRVIMTLLGVFAACAIVLAAIGLYGVMSYTVRQRTHEIGIRMALGARTGDVLRWAVRRGIVLTAVGAAIGLLGSLLLSRFLQNLLFGVAATDFLTLAAALLLLGAVAVAASYLPARRAASVDPVLALRYE